MRRLRPINRAAFIVRPKKLFLEWAANLDEKAPKHAKTLRTRASVYLVPEDPTKRHETPPLERYFLEIFRHGVDPVSWTLFPLGEEEFTMRKKHPKKHPSYPPEYRRQMVELVRVGRTPEELAREFEPSAQTIRNWVKQADLDEGRREDGLTTEEREELRRLRRENKQLRLEREILSKAAAWFARETETIPPSSSSS
jgi:transposase